MCMPLQALQGERIDALVVGGIGMDALNKLGAAGIRVHLGRPARAGDLLEDFKAGRLAQMDPTMACGQHDHA
jgi:predicted Fe-Mo cluster-binding NifX family protein